MDLSCKKTSKFVVPEVEIRTQQSVKQLNVIDPPVKSSNIRRGHEPNDNAQCVLDTEEQPLPLQQSRVFVIVSDEDVSTPNTSEDNERNDISSAAGDAESCCFDERLFEARIESFKDKLRKKLRDQECNGLTPLIGAKIAQSNDEKVKKMFEEDRELTIACKREVYAKFCKGVVESKVKIEPNARFAISDIMDLRNRGLKEVPQLHDVREASAAAARQFMTANYGDSFYTQGKKFSRLYKRSGAVYVGEAKLKCCTPYRMITKVQLEWLRYGSGSLKPNQVPARWLKPRPIQLEKPIGDLVQVQ
ncbi:hypothetical protein Aperf_G00000003677 [Anoplocephala perfoliata]